MADCQMFFVCEKRGYARPGSLGVSSVGPPRFHVLPDYPISGLVAADLTPGPTRRVPVPSMNVWL